MRRITLVTLVTVSCIILATPVMAQQDRERGGARQRQTIEQRIEELSKVLDLSEDQKAEITKIWTEQRANMQQRMQGQQRPEGQEQSQRRPQGEGGGMRGGGMRGGMMGGGALEKVLTAEQMEKYSEYQAQNRVRMRIEMMSRRLNLTDDQQAKLTAIIIGQNEKMASMMDSEDQDRRTRQREMRKIQQETDKAIEEILNEEQVKTYRSMPRGGGRQ